MRQVLLFIFSLLFSYINAQVDILETSTKINDLVFNKISNEIIYANDRFVYYADYETLAVKDSVKIISDKNQYINRLQLLNTQTPALIIYSKTKNNYYLEFYEYPSDSTYILNLNNKVVGNKFSGNLYASYNQKNPKQSVVAYNKFNRYKNKTGHFVNGAIKGVLNAYPEKIMAESNGVVRNLQISNGGKEMAVIYYDSITNNNNYHYTLETRTLPSLKVLKTESILSKTKSIYFSENDAYLVLKKDLNNLSSSSLSVIEDVEVYNAQTLEKLENLPDNLFIESLIENGSIWKKVKNDIINETYKTKRNLNKIWSNLTPFSIIDGFVKVNTDELLIYGNKGYGFSEEKNGIYKYSLSNEAVFSKESIINLVDTLFNPNAIKLANNKVVGSRIQLNKTKSTFLLSGDNSLQIWDALDKRKLYDLQFENIINPFLNDSGNSILIFESFTGKSFNEFKLNFLDLKTGIANVTLFKDSDFDALRSKCYNIDEDTGEWLCNDGSAKLWKVNAKNKTIDVLNDFSNANFYRTNIEFFKKVPNTNDALISVKSVNVAPNHEVIDSKFEGFKIYNSKSKQVSEVSKISNALLVFPISNNDILYQAGNNLQLFNSKSQTTSKIISNSKYKLLETVNHNDIAYIILENMDNAVDSFMVHSYHVKNKKINNTFKIPYSSGFFSTDDGLHFKDSDTYSTYNPKLKETALWNNPKPLFTQSTDLSLAKNGKMLFKNKWLFDLKTLELETEMPSFYSSILLEKNKLFYIKTKQYNVDKPHFKFIISAQNNLDSIFWESTSYPIKDYVSPNVLVYSKNKKYILAYYNSGYNGQTLYLIDTETKTVKTKKIDFYLKTLAFTEDENQLVLTYKTSNYPFKTESRFFNVNTFNQTSVAEANYLGQFNSNSILHVSGQFLIKSSLNANTLKEDQTYYARKYLAIAKYLNSKNLLVAGTNKGELLFWTPENKSPIKTIKISNSKILKFEVVNKKLFVLSSDSEISIVNLDELELEATCLFFEKESDISMAWFTPNGYFKATKNDIRNFHFVKDGKTFPLLNYELFLNRPDVIMKKVGFTPTQTIEIYKQAYLKRLKRNNLTEQTDFLSIERPKVSLINRQSIASIINSNSLQLEIDNVSNADTLNVYINGVPVVVEPVKNKSVISKNVKLNFGLNNISIVSRLKSGIESDPIMFETKNIAPKKESKVYYAGIGVSKYLDSSMNLKYADKDVRRLSEVLSNKFKGRIIIDTLLNQNVTLENVKSIKARLKETSIDDTVIISFSGHGLIDKDDRFYFAAHNIDFSNPQLNGISYEVIQDLLSDIPARKKLLLLDACHSGEIDLTQDLKATVFANKNVTENILEGAKGSKVVKGNRGLNSSFELMQSLFYDMDRGNGAYVISAAGGHEFAYEDEKWENGVFTYSLINAIYDLGYDVWEGESGIPISKIKKYVYDSVKTLTNGKQKPTARAENLEWDWRLE